MSFNIRRAPRLALIAAAFAFSQSALAATVTETYSFNLSNFVSTPGSTPSMVTDISATFTVTFDPAVQVIDQAAGITVDSFHAPGSGGVFASLPIVFSFFPNVLPGIDLLSIGGTSPDGETLLPGENDLEFYASFTDPGAPSLVPCTAVSADVCGPNNVNGFIGGYALATDSTDLWHPATGTVSAVPEPATLSLLGLGLAGVGFMRKRKPK